MAARRRSRPIDHARRRKCRSIERRRCAVAVIDNRSIGRQFGVIGGNQPAQALNQSNDLLAAQCFGITPDFFAINVGCDAAVKFWVFMAFSLFDGVSAVV